MPSAEYLIWIDLEMTGLKPDTDVIIEIATVVTDKNLEVIAEGPNLAIHQPDEVLARMDEWNTRHPATRRLGSHGTGEVQHHHDRCGRGANACVPDAARRGRRFAHVRQQHLPGQALSR
jgi:hypothetical protein